MFVEMGLRQWSRTPYPLLLHANTGCSLVESVSLEKLQKEVAVD